MSQSHSTTPPIAVDKLDSYLRSHLIEPGLLRGDGFKAFMEDRQKRLLGLIEAAMGEAAYIGAAAEEGEDVDDDEDAAEAGLALAQAQ